MNGEAIILHVHCPECEFSAKYKLEVNEHGFFEIPDTYCPNDMFLCIQEIKKEK